MPKMNYDTIVAPPVNGKALGTRNETSLKQIFATSPLYIQDKSSPAEGDLKLTPEDYKTWFVNNVVNGAVPGSGGYYGFNPQYSRDFEGAPDLTDVNSIVKNGAGGNPSTPFVPNPASPGAGPDGTSNGVDYNSKPAATDFAAKISAKSPSTPGVGSAANAAARNPAETSKAMKTLTLGQALGQSPATAVKGL